MLMGRTHVLKRATLAVVDVSDPQICNVRHVPMHPKTVRTQLDASAQDVSNGCPQR